MTQLQAAQYLEVLSLFVFVGFFSRKKTGSLFLWIYVLGCPRKLVNGL